MKCPLKKTIEINIDSASTFARELAITRKQLDAKNGDFHVVFGPDDAIDLEKYGW